MLFLQSKPVISIKTDLGLYKAGALSVIGLEGVDAYKDEIIEYIRGLWGYNKDTKEFMRNSRKDKIERDAVITFLFNKGAAVLMSDTDGVFSPSALVELATQNPEQFDACYRAALRQNPKLAPVGYVDSETEKFQAETKEEAAAKN